MKKYFPYLILLLMSTMALGWSLKETKEGQGIDIITRDTGEGSPTKKGEIKPDGTIVIEKIQNSAGDTPEGGVPAGSVMAFVGSTAPTGWFIADGSCKTTSEYPKLEAAVTTGGWDQTGCAVGEFKLPNLSGQFLRGAGGSGPSLGATQADATAKNNLQASSSSVSTGSCSANQSGHTHYVASTDGRNNTSPDYQLRLYPTYTMGSYWDLTGDVREYYLSGVTGTANAGKTNSVDPSISCSIGGTWTAAAQTISGDTETRPANVGVNYIIKY